MKNMKRKSGKAASFNIAEVVELLCDQSWKGIVDSSDLPACLWGCSSWEELALKIEVAL